MGVLVDVSLSTEKLSPLSMLWSVHVLDNLLVSILVSSLRPVSIRVIGLVFLKLPLQVSFLGMRIIVACFHSVGMLLWWMQLSINFLRAFLSRAGALFHISFGILNGPGLLFVGRSLIASSNSWLVVE